MKKLILFMSFNVFTSTTFASATLYCEVTKAGSERKLVITAEQDTDSHELFEVRIDGRSYPNAKVTIVKSRKGDGGETIISALTVSERRTIRARVTSDDTIEVCELGL